MITLTDSEFATVLDSLRETGVRLTNAGVATPSIDSAKKKLHSITTPATRGVTVLPNDAEPTLRQALHALHAASENGTGSDLFVLAALALDELLH